MMKHKRYYVLVLLMTSLFAASILFPEEVLARRGMGGFRGGGRSFSKSRSSSWGSTKSRKLQSQRGRQSPRSKADKALYNKAKSQGTVFSNRAGAKKAFTSKYRKKYDSRYTSKPSTRPDHIPKSTKIDGRTTPVSYNQQYGGYGYYGAGGRWMLYSVMADAAMMGVLMNRHHYYYGASPGMYQRGGGSSFSGLFVVGVIVFLVIIMRRRF